MRFMGQEAVSRPTRGTGRILVSLAFVIWFTKFYDIPLQELEVNGIGLPPADDGYVIVQWLATALLVGSHLMNWWGDHVAYKGWNIRDKVTAAAGFGSATALVTRLDSVLRTVKEKAGDQSEESIAIDMLREIRSEVIRLNTFAGMYIRSWLVVPVGCSVLALLW